MFTNLMNRILETQIMEIQNTSIKFNGALLDILQWTGVFSTLSIRELIGQDVDGILVTVRFHTSGDGVQLLISRFVTLLRLYIMRSQLTLQQLFVCK